jgi:type I restriction enzyme R subunit
LNRRAPGKTDTFVLDFVNESDEIYKAFRPYYETTEIGDLPDPQQLYTLQNDLKESPVIHPSDIEQFAEGWSATGKIRHRVSTSNLMRFSTGPLSGTNRRTKPTRKNSR